MEWPKPPSRLLLQRFLGFANFYRRFIRDFSRVALPLTQLTSPKVPFQWNDAAQSAFQELKSLFSLAPVLVEPDLTLPFLVEVNASYSGVGAVSSQQQTGKLHPCAFFSRHLSPAEQNYDVGDRELLAIKLTLKEWRHCLEGTTQPFVVWTDHKNLAYLQSAKRFNTRQARWALFFTRFHFTITYRPGSRNVKADALSRQFSALDKRTVPAPILPATCTVGAIAWEIEEIIRNAQETEPDPGGGLLHRLFVPQSVRSQVLHWAQTACFTCHPGVQRTIKFLQRYFWWPSLTRDVQEYVSTCTVCARNKPSHQPPAGQLHPLSTPSRPL